jgi:hypothetical protein
MPRRNSRRSSVAGAREMTAQRAEPDREGARKECRPAIELFEGAVEGQPPLDEGFVAVDDRRDPNRRQPFFTGKRNGSQSS